MSTPASSDYPEARSSRAVASFSGEVRVARPDELAASGAATERRANVTVRPGHWALVAACAAAAADTSGGRVVGVGEQVMQIDRIVRSAAPAAVATGHAA